MVGRQRGLAILGLLMIVGASSLASFPGTVASPVDADAGAACEATLFFAWGEATGSNPSASADILITTSSSSYQGEGMASATANGYGTSSSSGSANGASASCQWGAAPGEEQIRSLGDLLDQTPQSSSTPVGCAVTDGGVSEAYSLHWKGELYTSGDEKGEIWFVGTVSEDDGTERKVAFESPGSLVFTAERTSWSPPHPMVTATGISVNASFDTGPSQDTSCSVVVG